MTMRKDHLAVAGFAAVPGFVVARVKRRAEGDGLLLAPVGVHLALPTWTERSWRFGVKGYLRVTEIHYQRFVSSQALPKISRFSFED